MQETREIPEARSKLQEIELGKIWLQDGAPQVRSWFINPTNSSYIYQ